MMSLLMAPIATDRDSTILPTLGELADCCRRFADSDCCDTEAFRAIVHGAERLSRRIPTVCAPLSELVYWVLVVFKTRPADLDRNGAHAMARALESVDTIYLEPQALADIRRRLANAGINLRPF